MEELDERKLEIVKKYLEKEDKIKDLTKTQEDFFSLVLVFIVGVVPIALFLQLYMMLGLIPVCLIPGGICLISELQKNKIKKSCLDDSMTLKEFNKFLKSKEYNTYASAAITKNLGEEKEKAIKLDRDNYNTILSIDEKKENLTEVIVTKPLDKVNKPNNTTKR